jgi:ABC-2 type transport system ATP-binding protein
MTEYALVVKNLRKSYGGVPAVDDISFSIRRGAIFCFVGPNGAGKTTTMEIIEGLKKPDSGEIHLLGMSLPRELRRAREVMGVQLQTTSLFDRLTVGETVNLFRAFYARPLAASEALRTVSLDTRERHMVATLSGGQRQRLAIALALLNDPEILFLDEPTAGLDPQARREVWRMIESLRERGKTIFLTTHYMDEAEKLGDEVAIIDHGKIIAHDTPRNFIVNLNAVNVIEFSTSRPLDKSIFSSLRHAREVSIVGSSVVVYTPSVKDCIVDLVGLSEGEGFEMSDMRFRNPSLEDVFIELTGRMLRE